MGKLQEKLELTVLAIAGNVEEQRIWLIEEQLETITTPEQILKILDSIHTTASDLAEKSINAKICAEAISEAMDKIEKAGVEMEW